MNRQDQIRPDLCPEPWQRMVVGLSGQVVPCCFRPWKDAFGNLKHQSWQEIWNGEHYQKLRSQMKELGHEGACPDCLIRKTNGIPPLAVKPELIQGQAPYAINARLLLKEYVEAQPVLEAKCTSLTLSPSGKCNLRCIQCAQREAHFYKESIGENSLKAMQELLPVLDVLGLGGGEPMVMDEYRYCIDNIKNLGHVTFSLITNGVLLDDDQLSNILKFYSGDIGISVDAGSGDVYEKVRGGSWDTLHDNLVNLSQKRAKNPNIFFAGSYTINKLNVLDLSNYIELCTSLKFSSCFYYVWHYPPDLRPDIFCDVDQETVGWEGAFTKALSLAEKFDDARFPEAFNKGKQYSMLPFLREYIQIILDGMAKSRTYAPRRFFFGEKFAEKFVVISDTATKKHIAYGYFDNTGNTTIRVPSEAYSATIYDDRYLYNSLDVFHF